ncbi:flavin-dependent oxidoreductase [Sulfitobacter sp. PS-8MA]|uniref:flavin-dependent oxidoreductase n=1 Tax=Sulfitobacter sp. PS-8MA TaxID=3237707 RepID=UPI0034C66CF4
MTILIAGGGIGGLALALTCHQIGAPFRVFEAAETIRPLGVGINLQPTAVRELMDLGLGDRLDGIGVKTRDYGMYSKLGLHIWTEPRGTWAGYKWPQYSVHRGQLQMMLLEALMERAGPDCIETGWSAVGFDSGADDATLHLRDRSGQRKSVKGSVILGADGIHSTIRKIIAPHEGAPKWGGAVLWRGTTQAVPFKSGASMVMIGHDGLRFVSYPISKPDPATGRATINWIANLTYDPDADWNKEDWNREAKLDDFLPQFSRFDLDWIDIPGLIKAADKVFEYPMVDRDPLARWTHGRVSLMGDAAHAAYPVGSNGAGSAIIDARKLGAAFIAHGMTEAALQSFEDEMRPKTTKVIEMNRVAGPDSILDIVEQRSGGQFNDIAEVISTAEMAEHARKYKLTAGYGIEETNASPPTIPKGAAIGPMVNPRERT